MVRRVLSQIKRQYTYQGYETSHIHSVPGTAKSTKLEFSVNDELETEPKSSRKALSASWLSKWHIFNNSGVVKDIRLKLSVRVKGDIELNHRILSASRLPAEFMGNISRKG